MRGLDNFVVIVIAIGMMTLSPAMATLTHYSGNEAGFNAAKTGLPTAFIDFDNDGLTVGEIINNQYNPPVSISTPAGRDITVQETCHGPSALSGPYCAVSDMAPHEPVYGTFTMDFPTLAWGVSLFVGDVNNNITVSVFDVGDQSLGSYQVSRTGDWTHVAVLSDSRNVARIHVQTQNTGDGIGFDDVTVVVPEPSTLLIFLIGGLTWIRRKH